MNRHAKASSAGSTSGTGSSRGLFGRAFATRGVSSDAKGSGAPSHRPRRSFAGSSVLLLALTLLVAAAPAAADQSVFDFFGSTGSGAGQFAAGGTAPNVGAGGLAVNNVTGDVYVADRIDNRISQWDSDENFIRAWGMDVISNGAVGTGILAVGSKEVTTVVTTSRTLVAGQEVSVTAGAGALPAGTTITAVTTGAGAASKLTLSKAATAAGSVTLTAAAGSGNSAPQNEQQKVSVSATGGNFKLVLKTTLPTVTGTTANIPPTATATTVKSALEALTNVGAGNVEVSGATGGPYTVEFKGTRFANTNVPQMTATSTLTGAGAVVMVETLVEGAGTFEKCTAATTCQAGTVSGISGGMGSPASVAVDQSTGNVYVTDSSNTRVDEFDSSGNPIRNWGGNVVESGPDNKPEVQSLKVVGSSGTFALSFSGKATTAAGTGTTVNGSNEITALTSTGTGAFLVGEEISGAGIPLGTKITGVGVGTLLLSANAEAGASGVALTANLPYNASAALVEQALNALSSIGGSFGSVTVSGASPYQVTFGGVGLANKNVEQISINANGLGVAVGTELPCTAGPVEGPTTLTYEWLRNGTPIGSATSATYTTVAEDAGKSLQCKAKATNSEGAGVKASTPPVTVSPFPATAPPLPGSPSIAGTATVGATLTCNEGTWTGSGISFAYKWLRNGTALGGAVAKTYVLQAADNQTAIQCEVTGTNAAAAAVADTNRTVIRSEPPANDGTSSTAPTIEGIAEAPGKTLTCKKGTWTVGSPSFAYQWLRNGATIDGATAETYVTVEADKGAAIQCRVTATTSGGSAAAVSGNTVIAPVPSPTPPARPTIALTVTSSGGLNIGQTLTCLHEGKWTPESPAPTFTYQWLRNGSPISGATAESYVLAEVDIDKLVQCQVIATNTSGASSIISPAPATGAVVVRNIPAASSASSLSAGGTVTQGAGPEVCNTAADICRTAEGGESSLSGLGGKFGAGLNGYLAFSPAGPYAGDLFVADPIDKRIQIFMPNGTFVGAFGKETVESGPELSGKHICLASLGDVCQNIPFFSSTPGTAAEQYGFANTGSGAQPPTRFAFAPTGAIYVINKVTLQKYSPDLITEKDFATFQCSGKEVDSQRCTDVMADPSNGDVYIAYNIPVEGNSSLIKETAIIKVDPEGGKPGPGGEEPEAIETDLLGAGVTPINGFAFDGSTGNERSGRIYLTTGSPEQRIDVLGEPTPPSVELDEPDPEEVDPHDATVTGTINPEGNKIHTTYHFEYLRSGQVWTQYPLSNVDIGNGTAPVAVEQTISGLRANTKYLVRLTAFKGQQYTTPVRSFTTPPAGPDIETGEAQWSGPPASEPSLTFSGTLDDNNLPAHYFFEYGTDTSYGNRVPIFETGSYPAAQEPALVRQTINGLDPAGTYHYRLVAHTASGPAVGSDGEIGPAVAAGRFPEMVSPSNKGVAKVGNIVPFAGQEEYQADPAGGRLAYDIEYGDSEATAGGDILELGVRSSSGGWDNSQISPPSLAPAGSAYLYHQAAAGEVLWQAPDLGCGVVQSHGPLTADTPALDVENNVEHLFLKDGNGNYTRITPNSFPTSEALYFVAGGSPDCTRILFQTSHALLSGLPPEGVSHIFLYEWEASGGPNGTLRSAEVLPDGSIPSGGATFGARSISALNAVSRPDASRAFFTATSTAGGDAGKSAVFVRKNHAVTVDVSQSQTATPNNSQTTYQLAAADGSKVFFTARYGLAANGTSSGGAACAWGAASVGCDLYVYDVDTGTLKDLTPDTNPADTAGATVMGVYGASDDGSYVYFTARGQLIPGKGKTYAETSAGSGSAAGGANVYVSHSGALSFVGTVTENENFSYESTFVDEALYQFSASRVTPSGKYLLFRSKANLTPYNSGGAGELYRYSAPEDTVACVSCRPDGQLPVKGGDDHMLPSFWNSQGASNYIQRAISNDGSTIFFNTNSPLTPDAIVGSEQWHRDAYEWHNGAIRSLGVGEFKDMSADGSDAYVITSQALVPQDQDVQPDMYDLRIEGGFPYVPPQPCDPLTENSCQGTPPAPPAPTANPASSEFSGPGNPAVAPVESHHKKRHHKKAHKRAAKHQGGGAK